MNMCAETHTGGGALAAGGGGATIPLAMPISVFACELTVCEGTSTGRIGARYSKAQARDA